jgi:uncharacterized protein (DUF433 family)
MGTNGYQFIGLGLYTVPEASRLARVSVGRVRRWLRGYTFTTRTGRHKSPPVVTSQLPPLDGGLTVTFLDLQEIRLVNAFLEAGVQWKTLRLARIHAEEAIGPYPFSRGRFETDGRDIFYDMTPMLKSDGAFLNLVSHQTSFKRIVARFMVSLKFDAAGQAIEWWPMGKNRLVVLNPQRSFGHPIVPREGVPTSILSRSYRVERSYSRVARWYIVSERAVRDAVEYEESLVPACGSSSITKCPRIWPGRSHHSSRAPRGTTSRTCARNSARTSPTRRGSEPSPKKRTG